MSRVLAGPITVAVMLHPSMSCLLGHRWRTAYGTDRLSYEECSRVGCPSRRIVDRAPEEGPTDVDLQWVTEGRAAE